MDKKETPKYKIKGIEVKDESKITSRSNAPAYKPDAATQEAISQTFMRFIEMRDNRDQAYRWFGKKRDGSYRNLTQYVDMSRKRWNSDGVPRTDLDEWQASVFKPETRNKVITILSVIAQQRPRNNFKGVEESDYLKELIVKDLYDWTEEADDGDEKALYAAMDAIVDGTVVRYEGYDERVRVVRDILPESDFTTNDLKFKENTIITKEIVTKEVKLEDFYPGNVRVRASRMKEMPDCIWRKVMRINDFKAEFNGWPMAKFVLPGGQITDETFFSVYISDQVGFENSELVEVLRYYNKEADQFIILANGVWVNPIGTSKVSPLPFNHKQLPFWGFCFEPFASDFFWGKSLPDKMKDEQDAINALYNIMIDQGFISGNPILLTGNPDAIDDPDLIPGQLNYVGTDVNSIKELKLSGPDTSLFNLVNLLGKSLQQSSSDNIQQGQNGSGSTATEVRESSMAAARSFTLFMTFMFHGYKTEGKLRSKNILQFLTSPSQITRYLGADGATKFDQVYAPFNIHNTTLSTGKTGKRVIQMVGSKEELMSKFQNRQQEQQQLEPTNVEKIYITPDYIRDFDADVYPIPDSNLKENPEVMRALETNFQTAVMTLYPDKVNRDAMFDDYLEVYQKDKERLKLQPGQTPFMMPGANGQGQQGQGGTPISSQVAAQATGGASNQGPGLSLNKLTQ